MTTHHVSSDDPLQSTASPRDHPDALPDPSGIGESYDRIHGQVSAAAAHLIRRFLALPLVLPILVTFTIIAGHVLTAGYLAHIALDRPGALAYTTIAATAVAYTAAWTLAAIIFFVERRRNSIERYLERQSQIGSLLNPSDDQQDPQTY